MINFPSKYISKLNLSNSNLKKFPIEVLTLKNLKKLDLSGNMIDEIPKEIENLKYLQLLDISNNQIKNFQSKICGLKSLRVLNLNNNFIKTVPKQIAQLEKLQILQLANNDIQNLPTEIGDIKQLKELNISKNRIENFPQEVLQLKNLKTIWLNNLNLHSFPILDLNKMENLKAIYCFGISPNPNLDKYYSELSKLRGNSIARMRLLSKLNILDNPNTLSDSLKKINKNKIFISYSHKDAEWLEEVKTNLKVLSFNDHDFEVWDDTKLKGSEEWFKEISNALNNSGIAILLVSTYFLASEFIRNEELPKLLHNADNHGTKILPLIVRPCRFTKDKQLSVYQSVNLPSKPLSSLSQSEWESELVNLTNVVSELLLK